MLRASKCHTAGCVEDGILLRRQASFEGQSPSVLRARQFSGVYSSSVPPVTPQNKVAQCWVLPTCYFMALLLMVGASTRSSTRDFDTLSSQTQELRHALSALQRDIAALANRDSALRTDITARLDRMPTELAEHMSSINSDLRDDLMARLDQMSTTVDAMPASLADHLSSAMETTSAVSAAGASAIVGQFAEHFATLESALEHKWSKVEDIAAAAPTASAGSAPLQPTIPQPTSPASPPAAPERGRSRFVEVKFELDSNSLTSHGATLYWLRKNISEHAYAEIQPGGYQFERTYPGECWRVCDSFSGNQLMSQYCATTEPQQHVRITAKQHVLVEFAYPQQGSLSADSIEIIETHEATAGSPSIRLGAIARGHFLTAPATAGTTFDIRETGTGRLLQQFRASGEERQYITVGATAVKIEFVADRFASRPLHLLRVRPDGDEHLERTLEPGEGVRVLSSVGEEWVLREKWREAVVMRATATAEASQRILIAEPR